jgi:hypothetical protein
MSNEQEHLKAITDIRSMMERSSRFISLSGLSGIFAGIIALVGAAAAFIYLNLGLFSSGYYERGVIGNSLNFDYLMFFFFDGIIVLFLALLFGTIFTVRNAKKKNIPIWDNTTKLLLINLFIPLAAGGFFVLILVHHQLISLVAPATLIFYGMALLNASKYTFKDVRYLGIFEIILGLLSSIYIGYGLLFWAMGFGILHIIYGTVMYYKYER